MLTVLEIAQKQRILPILIKKNIYHVMEPIRLQEKHEKNTNLLLKASDESCLSSASVSLNNIERQAPFDNCLNMRTPRQVRASELKPAGYKYLSSRNLAIHVRAT